MKDYVGEQLFRSKAECCAEHQCDDSLLNSDVQEKPANEQPNDVVTHAHETFESGNLNGLPWKHTGVAHWHITRHKAHQGTHSMRSGNLNGQRGAPTDATLKIDSASGGILKFWYLADVSDPFDFFEFKLDGSVRHRDGAPSGQWSKLELGISPGPHEITFRVASPSSALTFDRSVDIEHFGEGVVYIDNLEWKPSR